MSYGLRKVATEEKMKFSIENFFSICDKIHRLLQIWSHLLKKALKENFIFSAVCNSETRPRRKNKQKNQDINWKGFKRNKALNSRLSIYGHINCVILLKTKLKINQRNTKEKNLSVKKWIQKQQKNSPVVLMKVSPKDEESVGYLGRYSNGFKQLNWQHFENLYESNNFGKQNFLAYCF